MISAVCWVPRGAAKPVLPEQEEAGSSDDDGPVAVEEYRDEEDEDEDEDDEELRDAESSSDGEEDPSAPSHNDPMGIEEAFKKLDMDNYDDEDDGKAASMRIFGAEPLTVFKSNKDDPYITLPDSDDESEKEDDVIRETDRLILAARTEDDVSTLEVWVYEDDDSGDGNLYVHHDLLLPAFPLSLAWLDCPPGAAAGAERGNFVAIGTMRPEVEIWDLDDLGAVGPRMARHHVLGGYEPRPEAPEAEAEGGAAEGENKKKKKKKKKPKVPQEEEEGELRPGSHADAVLGIAWNEEYRNILATASADKTVKVWDVATGACEHTLTHHADKVQGVAWNRAAPSVLLTGSFDRTAQVVDVRQPSGAALRFSVPADVEHLAWNPTQPEHFVVSAEDGHVLYFDARAASGGAGGAEGAAAGKKAGKKGAEASAAKALWTLRAHDKPTTALSFCPAVAGLLATGSTDKTVKLWDVSGGRPSQLAAKEVKVGSVFTVSFCADRPFLLAASGAKGTVAVWDTRWEGSVQARWPGSAPPAAAAAAGGDGGADEEEEEEEEKGKSKKKSEAGRGSAPPAAAAAAGAADNKAKKKKKK